MWVKFIAVYLVLTKDSAFLKSLKNSNELQCKDENNQPVDWFVMYKLPKIKESSNPQTRNGTAYLYMTSETVAEGWKLSSKNIGSKDSIPGNTLAPIYNDDVSTKAMWVMYNDQSPESNNSNAKYGHSKGVVMAGSQKGFWLIHSVPSFPAAPRAGVSRKPTNSVLPDGEYAYPDSGRNYGQSFLCISVKSDQVDVIAGQLMYNQIIMYRKNSPSSLAIEYPLFLNASNGQRNKKAPFTKKVALRSVAGSEFISFAKSNFWGKDLYDDFVAPQLNSDLFTETWLNGRGKLPSECNNSHVQNIKSVVLNAANVDFKSSRDHSKWAVSATKGKKGAWVCIGDINRADTQFSRGGGTVCLNSSELWLNYRNSVNDVEPCPRLKRNPENNLAK